MHKPVLFEETLEGLITKPEGLYVDCTLGGGGHLGGLAKRLGTGAKIIAIDKDAEILANTAVRFDDQRISLVHGDFRDLQSILLELGLFKLDGILLDLGVSSFQLDQGVRGFSYHEDAALDMRMDRSQAFDAADLVNTWEEVELARIIYEYGEERYSRRIARNIVRARAKNKIESTLQLVQIIKSSVPGSYKGEKHPARRTFQALRIAVNDELGALEAVLPQAVELLQPGGRLAVITFHSLEDRMVKRYFQSEASPCDCPKDFPICICNRKARIRLINRKAITASPAELEENPRARSAHLRIMERL